MKRRYLIYTILLLIVFVPTVYADCFLGTNTTKDVYGALKIFKIVAPLLMLGFTIFDLVKMLATGMTPGGKEVPPPKQVARRFGKRLIAVLLLFILPILINQVFIWAGIWNDDGMCDLSEGTVDDDGELWANDCSTISLDSCAKYTNCKVYRSGLEAGKCVSNGVTKEAVTIPGSTSGNGGGTTEATSGNGGTTEATSNGVTVAGKKVANACKNYGFCENETDGGVQVINGVFYYKSSINGKESSKGSGSIKNLNKTFQARLEKFFAAADAAGYTVWVKNEGWRSYKQQEYYYCCYKGVKVGATNENGKVCEGQGKCNSGNKAAVPGQSNHGWGIAADLGFCNGKNNKACKKDSKAVQWAHDHVKEYGLSFTVSGEDWHIGIDSADRVAS